MSKPLRFSFTLDEARFLRMAALAWKERTSLMSKEANAVSAQLGDAIEDHDRSERLERAHAIQRKGDRRG